MGGVILGVQMLNARQAVAPTHTICLYVMAGRGKPSPLREAVKRGTDKRGGGMQGEASGGMQGEASRRPYAYHLFVCYGKARQAVAPT
jgi:hypothetical protein